MDDVLECILDKGVKLESKFNGPTELGFYSSARVLEYVCSYGTMHMINCVIKHDTKIKESLNAFYLLFCNAKIKQFLNAQYIEYLIASGLCVNDDALISALRRSTPEIIKIIINNLDSNIKKPTNVLEAAINYSTPEIIRIIIDKLEIRNMNILNFACEHAKPDIIKLLIERGANLKEYSNHDVGGPTKYPIHSACKYSTLDVIQKMVEAGIDLECRTDWSYFSNDIEGGWKPIHYACAFSTLDVVKYLIDMNVNMESKTKDGANLLPINLLNKKDVPEIIEYMKKNKIA